nr:hypothetical protein [Rhodoferax sp.]
MNIIHIPHRHFALTVIGTILLTGAALAGPSNTPADAQARYRQDMAACDSGQSNQPQNVCRTEARNALAEAKRGGLTDAASDQYARNAIRRCAEFQGDDRTACEARVFNPSRVDGSVGGGGLVRESIVIVPSK